MSVAILFSVGAVFLALILGVGSSLSKLLSTTKKLPPAKEPLQITAVRKDTGDPYRADRGDQDVLSSDLRKLAEKIQEKGLTVEEACERLDISRDLFCELQNHSVPEALFRLRRAQENPVVFCLHSTAFSVSRARWDPYARCFTDPVTGFNISLRELHTLPPPPYS